MTTTELVEKALALRDSGTVDVKRPFDAAYMESAFRLAQALDPELYAIVKAAVAATMTAGRGDYRTCLYGLAMAGLMEDDLTCLLVAALAQKASDELVSGN
jgi:hypothetical protein